MRLADDRYVLEGEPIRWLWSLAQSNTIGRRLGLILPISETHMVWTCAAPVKLLEEAGVRFDPSNGGAFRASTQAVASSPENALEVSPSFCRLRFAAAAHVVCLRLSARWLRCKVKCWR